MSRALQGPDRFVGGLSRRVRGLKATAWGGDAKQIRRPLEAEWVGKPNSVWGVHSSRPAIAGRLMRPTRNSKETGRLPFAEANSLPIWACWRWGLPCDDCHQSPGALLPHHFTLTCKPSHAGTAPSAVSFLWHYPSGRPGSPLATTVPCPVRTFLTQCQRTRRANALPTPLPEAVDAAPRRATLKYTSGCRRDRQSPDN